MRYTVAFSISLSLLTLSCFSVGSTNPKRTQTGSSAIQLTWPLAARAHCIGDFITIKFFTSNKRAGYLVTTTDESSVPIVGTDDAGIYQLREIQWIECNSETVFPNY